LKRALPGPALGKQLENEDQGGDTGADEQSSQARAESENGAGIINDSELEQAGNDVDNFVGLQDLERPSLGDQVQDDRNGGNEPEEGVGGG